MRLAILSAAALMIAYEGAAPHAFAEELPGVRLLADQPYLAGGHERHVLDIYAPEGAEGLPVVFWIHGGGWVTGDKTRVQEKPRYFTSRGYVFVSTNHRFLPEVPMEDLVADVAKALAWTHAHIGEHGGDPRKILVMGHSSGAQLAALLCTDHRLLEREGVDPAVLKACVAVDGDTYDIPAIIETAETRARAHGFPLPEFGHRKKFGDLHEKHVDFSAVTHIAPDKGIPPFLVLHLAEHPDVSAQARRLGSALGEAGVPVTVHGQRGTDHSRINAEIGTPDDPVTEVLERFLDSLEGLR
jgi:arylformamidase